MTKAKTQLAADMPVTRRNGPNSATLQASKLLRDMRASLGSLRAISDELAKRGYPANKGYLSNVINLRRQANQQLLVALGLRKPPRPPMTDEQRAARKAERQIAGRMRLLYAYANAHCEVTLERLDMHWQVSITPRQIRGMQLISAVRDVSMIVAIDGAIASVEEWSKHRHDKTN